MFKRVFITLIAGALVASVFSVAPAGAQEVPAEPNIVDPPGDANFLNEGTIPGAGHNHSTPADASSLADILAVWFTNDAESVFLNIQTELAPPGSNGIHFSVYTNPGEGSAGSSSLGCLRFRIVIPGTGPGGGSYQGEQTVKIHDRCNIGGSFTDAPDGELAIQELADGTGLITVKAPRSASPFFAPGSTLTKPQAISTSPAVGNAAIGVIVYGTDDTEIGTDYVLSEGTSISKPPKPKKNPPAKGKGNRKGKKKGHKKPPVGCAAFTPGEAGKDQPTVTLTDAATEEAPVEQTVTLEQSTADLQVGDPSSTYFNIQVDSAAADAGLYAHIEFPTRRDYDLNLLHPDGSYAARSRGFNTVDPAHDGTLLSAEGHGGDSTDHSETLVGIKTADCGGWTLQVQNWLGEGGDFAVQLWLGEAQNDPQAEGEETP